MKYLGIDYGKKKIGLAISEGNLVSGFGSLKVVGLQDAVNKIQKIINDQQIDVLVVGLPESGEARSMVNKFYDRMKKDLEVVLTEETLSTYQATSQIRQLGGGDEDERAAMLILENYLESNDE